MRDRAESPKCVSMCAGGLGAIARPRPFSWIINQSLMRGHAQDIQRILVFNPLTSHIRFNFIHK
jgi:hypothetical protein